MEPETVACTYVDVSATFDCKLKLIWIFVPVPPVLEVPNLSTVKLEVLEVL